MTPSHLYDLGPVMHGDKGADLRLTRQRRVVYEVVVAQRDHPTSQDVYNRAKEVMPGISLATVYNCLEALTQVGLVRQVNLDRAPTRYCPNLEDHAHFHCDACGAVRDVALPECFTFDVPSGSVLRRQEITLRGLCPDCAGQPLN